MATPITWRNITSDTVGGASRALSGAQQAVQDVTKGLLGIVDDGNKLESSNIAALKNANTQSFLNTVASKSAAELADPAVQAQLAAQRQAIPAGLIDQAATRNAALEQGNLLQKAATATMDYNDKTQAVAQRPLEEQIATLVSNGDIKGAQKIADDNHLLNESKIREGITQAGTNLTNASYKAEDQVMQRQQFKTSQQQAQQSLAQGAESLSFSRFMHGEQRNEIAANHAADDTVRKVNDLFDNGQKAQQAAIQDIANKLELPKVPGTDDIDYGAMDANQAAALKSSLTARGVDGNFSSTQRNNTIQQLTKDLPVAAQKRALDNAATLDQVRGVAPADQQRLKDYVSEYTKPSTIAMNQLQIKEQAEKEKNTFLNFSRDPDKDAKSVVDGFTSKWKDVPMDSTQKKLISDTTKALRDGIDVTIGGKQVRVAVPPNMLASAYDAVGYDQGAVWGSPGSYKPDEVKKYIAEQIQNSPELARQAQAAPDLISAFAKERINLSRKLEADTSSAISSFTRKNGGREDTSGTMDLIDRAAKRK